jgi:hypothetical protein
MNITPDAPHDNIELRNGRTRTADGFQYYIIRTEMSVQRDCLPDVAHEVGRMLSELAHPFIIGSDYCGEIDTMPQHDVYGLRESDLPGARRTIEEAGYDTTVIEDCAPFKVPGQEAAGQLVIETGADTLPSPSLEMEGDV